MPLIINSSDTVTVEELKGYYKRRGWNGTFEAKTRRLVEDIRNHREPKYELGSYYMDADGRVWALGMYPDGEEYWASFDDAADHLFNEPKRPLDKLLRATRVVSSN